MNLTHPGYISLLISLSLCFTLSLSLSVCLSLSLTHSMCVSLCLHFLYFSIVPFSSLFLALCFSFSLSLFTNCYSFFLFISLFFSIFLSFSPFLFSVFLSSSVSFFLSSFYTPFIPSFLFSFLSFFLNSFLTSFISLFLLLPFFLSLFFSFSSSFSLFKSKIGHNELHIHKSEKCSQNVIFKSKLVRLENALKQLKTLFRSNWTISKMVISFWIPHFLQVGFSMKLTHSSPVQYWFIHNYRWAYIHKEVGRMLC